MVHAVELAAEPGLRSGTVGLRLWVPSRTLTFSKCIWGLSLVSDQDRGSFPDVLPEVFDEDTVEGQS